MESMTENNNTAIGYTSTPSTTQDVVININQDKGLDSLKNQLLYFDLKTNSGTVHRAIGFIHEVTTQSMSSDRLMNQLATVPSNNDSTLMSQLQKDDMRTLTLHVISTFSQDENGSWSGNAPLPTSPGSGTQVYIADEKDVTEMFSHLEDNTLSSLGTLRGANGIPAPMIMPYYGGSRGASSMGVVGKTGSGKTDLASKAVMSMMKYPDHCIITVDPQGQWGNENGFTLSPQRVAASFGRKVENLRVAENIQLPLTDDNFLNMLNQIDIWAKVGRMAKDNKDLLSQEVAEIITSIPRRRVNACNTEAEFQTLLSEILKEIAVSPSTIARIYASEDKQKSFAKSLYSLIDPAKVLIDDTVLASAVSSKLDLDQNLGRDSAIDELLSEGMILENDGSSATFGQVDYLLSPANPELARVTRRWNGILAKFIPLLNLFQDHNLSGGARKSLSGERGFLESVLKVRDPKVDAPAPYVILDMSPDTNANAQASLLGGKDVQLNMRRLLDNENIKASILMMIFSSLKEAAEDVFSGGSGNLNTQIVFDEAWRYAPDKSDNEIIMKLSTMLEGFALDTRKFGIGWTYILQSPTDLRHGIWKQLKFVYAGYGLVGADLARMSDLMDDASTQLRTYKQFVSPDLTGEYPFMIVGAISPLITASVPLFINSFNSIQEFEKANKGWMHANMNRVGNVTVSVDQLTPESILKLASQATKTHAVGNPRKDEDEFTSRYTSTKATTTKVNSMSDSQLLPPF